MVSSVKKNATGVPPFTEEVGRGKDAGVGSGLNRNVGDSQSQ